MASIKRPIITSSKPSWRSLALNFSMTGHRFVKPFYAIVLDVWKEKQAQKLTLMITLKQRIQELHQRRDRLEEAFVYERSVNKETI